MKKVISALLLSLFSIGALAVPLADPRAPDVIVEETTGSSAGILLPLLLLVVVAAAVAAS